MNIEAKHLLALIILVAVGSAGFFATLISQRVRDLALFMFLVGAVLIDRMDVMFLGQFWYRGTSRGIQLSAIDVAPICLLISTLLLPRYRRGKFYWPAGFGMLVVYFGYCCVSVGYADPQVYGIWELTKMFRGLLVFLAAALFIRTRRELAVVVAALACAAWLEAGNALEQRLFKGTVRPPGTLDHENTLSTYLCMIGPVLLAATLSNWSKWLRWFTGIACVFCAGAELLTLSRMGVPAFAVVMTGTAIACTSWKVTRRKAAIVALIVACTGGMVYSTWDGLKARFLQTNIEKELMDKHAVETRGTYWRMAFLMIEDHPYGVGLNNWSYFASKTYGRELGLPYTDYDDIKWIPDKGDAGKIFLAPAADSLPALTIGELGIAGTVVFTLVWLRWFQIGATFLRRRLNDDPVHRLGIGFLFGIAGLFLQSATEWTYRQPPVMFTLHVMLGALAGIYFIHRRGWAPDEEAADAAIDAEIETLPAHSYRTAE